MFGVPEHSDPVRNTETMINEQYEEHEKVWGKEHWIVNNERYCFKKLYLKENYQCSMHHHKIKDETFIIHSGLVFLEFGDNAKLMKPGDKVRIPTHTEHRFTGMLNSVIYEISTQHIESDSYRSIPSGKVDNSAT
jgi:mannose-6-phosphate isomerase-like protein (cupin superfamily)